ncbi:MAG: hypothetical protein FWD71_22240, partial [Oscillospiraceae bacterium]|nr:hypothetical protein [Oscillospiraceae bacterium]
GNFVLLFAGLFFCRFLAYISRLPLEADSPERSSNDSGNLFLHTTTVPFAARSLVFKFTNRFKKSENREETKLKNYIDSDYALNKYSEGIVYRFANKIVEITLEDYLTENPDKTEKDFLKLKKFSDNDYFEQDRAENAQTKKNTDLYELEGVSVKSPEESFIDEIDELEEAERKTSKIILAEKALNKLTNVQKRRYLMYHIEGLSMRKIAEKEDVSHSKIQNSLDAAENKIKKFLSES